MHVQKYNIRIPSLNRFVEQPDLELEYTVRSIMNRIADLAGPPLLRY